MTLVPEHHAHGVNQPGENTWDGAPSPLAVLLAGVGSQPLQVEQAHQSAIKIYDTFVLAPERQGLFFGAGRSLFRPQEAPLDPRHDPLARAIRRIASALRQRLEAYDDARPGSALIRGVSALSVRHIEYALAGYDFSRTSPIGLTTEVFIGSTSFGVDPLEAPDAGVLRRFISLAIRGLLAERGGSRAGGGFDLGGLALSLALVDLVVNPRSALRAARGVLAKSSRLAPDQSARVRDTAVAFRELLANAVSSASTGAASRDLVRETVLTPEVLEHLVVAMTRAVYDGLAPDDEHPLVVPGVCRYEAPTAAPLLRPTSVEDVADEPTVGIYNRIAFLSLPYAQLSHVESTVSEIPRAPRSSLLDESTFTRARGAIRNGQGVARALAQVSASLDAVLDSTDPRHRWRRAMPALVVSQIARTASRGPAGTHLVLLVGPRSTRIREILDTFSSALLTEGAWQMVVPRATDRTLSFEPLVPGANAGAALRHADVSRWLDDDVPRAMHWNVEQGANIVLNAAAFDGTIPRAIRGLAALARDISDKAEPRVLFIILGTQTYARAASALEIWADHPELESGETPFRGEAYVVRTDAPLYARAAAGHTVDEAVLVTLAEPFAPGSVLAELAAQAALLPSSGKYRGHLARFAALSNLPAELDAPRRATERAAIAPTGNAVRRALQAGISSLSITRSALAAGMGDELLGCMRHEVGLMLAEWEAVKDKPHSQRLADVARGQLVEILLSSHPRAAVLAEDTLAMALGSIAIRAADYVEVRDVLGARPGGTIYSRDDAPGSVPLGVVIRGGPIDLCVLVEPSVMPPPPRVPPSPYLELHFRPADGREAGLGMTAALVVALQDAVLHANHDVMAHVASGSGRIALAVLLDATLDGRFSTDAVRMVLPLQHGATDASAQQLAVELIAQIIENTDGTAREWSAQFLVDANGLSTIALSGPLLLRDFVSRWTQALRTLSRFFPNGGVSNGQYSPSPAVASASALGMVLAVLHKRGIDPATANGRAVLSRLAHTASEVMPVVKEVMALMPLRPALTPETDWTVVERCLAAAWFLQANFCCNSPGPLQWIPPGGTSVQPIIDVHLDRAALKLWLQRKVSRPPEVDERIMSFFSLVEPSIVIERQ